MGVPRGLFVVFLHQSKNKQIGIKQKEDAKAMHKTRIPDSRATAHEENSLRF
jgi:hypothetical protein